MTYVTQSPSLVITLDVLELRGSVHPMIWTVTKKASILHLFKDWRQRNDIDAMSRDASLKKSPGHASTTFGVTLNVCT
jgi:hypothetical protein